MRRFIYNTFVAISAIVLIVSVGLWVTSYFYETRVSITWNNNDYLLASLRGRALLRIDWNVGVGSNIWVDNLPQPVGSFNLPSYDRDAAIHFAGFGYDRQARWGFVAAVFGRWPNESYIVPYWIVALLAVVPVIHRLVNRPTHVAAGCCRACGYNLIGTPGKQCPECGEMIALKFRRARTLAIPQDGDGE